MPDPVTLLAAGSAIGGIANIFGAQSGAQAVNDAANKANAQAQSQLNQGLDTQKNYFDQGTAALKPIADQGTGVYGDLVKALPDLTAPITMDQKTLEATPGYGFNVQQGNRSIDLSSISRGMSGAQAKAAAAFGVNTANTLYKDQFDMANTNKTNAFNRLLQTAQVGTSAAESMAGNATSAGNAALAGATGTGKVQSENTMTAGKSQAGANVATGAQVGSMANTFAGLGANGNNINQKLSMYSTPA